MSTKKKMFLSAAGAAGGATTDIDDLFRTFMYDGNNGTQNIVNNIDLAGEGGFVWTKRRDSITNGDHGIYDSVRGATKRLRTNNNQEEYTPSDSVTAYNDNGFSIGADPTLNANGANYVSWTWRKTPKFFDIVTYTGNGVAGRTISHNLDGLVGMLVIKCRSHASDWSVQHRMVLPSKYLALNETAAQQTDTARFHSTAAGNSTFTVGSGNAVNGNGRTYVAYLFAHNNNGNPGGFGPDEDQHIIKCGSYNGNSTAGHVIDLGFEAQWVLVKNYTGSESWIIYDVMRGMPVDGNGARIRANDSENEQSQPRIGSHPNGFQLTTSDGECNNNSGSYIYMAIRRGPLAAPEDATKVFHVNQQNNADTFSVGFPTDLALVAKTGGSSSNAVVGSRLTGDDKFLVTNGSDAEASSSSIFTFDLQNSFKQAFSTSAENVSWLWKRAPSYFDVVSYTGTGSSSQTVSHNLGVVPEMMWIKVRSDTDNWTVYHSALGNDKRLLLNSTDAATGSNNVFFNNTSPTSSAFTVGSVANTSHTYVAYLFATLAGISKVGSYTGNGGTQQIDCGFSSGARFVLIKRSSNAQDWYIFDSTRGIVAGNDPYLRPNSTASEQEAADEIDPLSSGFTIHQTGSAGINFSGHTYIFYAIA